MEKKDVLKAIEHVPKVEIGQTVWIWDEGNAVIQETFISLIFINDKMNLELRCGGHYYIIDQPRLYYMREGCKNSRTPNTHLFFEYSIATTKVLKYFSAYFKAKQLELDHAKKTYNNVKKELKTD